MKKAVIVATLLLVIAGLGLWLIGIPAYRHHEERQAAQLATQYLAKGDLRKASVSARRALQLNSRSIEACRAMAELCELGRSPAALDWRRRVAETAPTIENKLKLAETAIRCQGPPFTLASQTLDEIGAAGQDVAAYHSLAAELAFKLRRPAEAAAHYEAASRLEPANEQHQLNLAVLQLGSTNSQVAGEARARLEKLSASPKVGATALRWLVSDALERGEVASGERFVRELAAHPRSILKDRLECLSILRETKTNEAEAYLADVKSMAATNSAQAYDMSVWLISRGMADEDLPWLTNLVASVRNEQPAPMALVDCYIAKKDWAGLQAFLDDQKWGELDYLRLANLSRAAEQQRQNLAADARWRAAVRDAGDRLGALTGLCALAGKWGRQRDYEDLLWQIAQRFPRERKAFFLALAKLYEATDNTSGLNRLASAKLTYNAKDFVAQNDAATTSLLLRLNLPRAHELAKEAYSEHPEEPIVASTYAFSLHVQRRTREGLGILEKLNPDAREKPPVVLYYGVLLAAAGETNQAAKCLEIAERSTHLLPEEKSLLAETQKHL